MSRDRCRAQKPRRQREPQTVVVTSNRGVIRPQVSSRVQISIRRCSLILFSLRYATVLRTRRGPAVCLSAPFIPIPRSVSASVLCDFPSRKFDEYLGRDLEALINPWQERGDNKLPAGPGPARLISERNN